MGKETHDVNFQRHKCPRPDGESTSPHVNDREEEQEMSIKQEERAWLKGGFYSERSNMILRPQTT